MIKVIRSLWNKIFNNITYCKYYPEARIWKRKLTVFRFFNHIIKKVPGETYGYLR